MIDSVASAVFLTIACHNKLVWGVKLCLLYVQKTLCLYLMVGCDSIPCGGMQWHGAQCNCMVGCNISIPCDHAIANQCNGYEAIIES